MGWNKLVAVSTAALAAGTLAAQTVVLPHSHATREGSGSSNVPFGRSAGMRVQMAYDPVPSPAVGTVHRLGLRLDGGKTARAKKVDLEIRLSTMRHGITAIQSQFARNTGADEVVVLARGVIDLPGLTAAKTPNPFHVSLPLQPKFRWTPSRGPLLVEIRVFGQQPGAFPIDTTFVCDSPRAFFGPKGCGAPGRILRTDLLTTQVLWGSRVSIRVANAPGRAGTALAFGTFEAGTWNGMRIPADLTAFGAPGCWMSTDPLLIRAAQADTAGNAVYAVTIPSVPFFLGQWVRYQGYALDPSANSLGVVSAQPQKVQVCGWESVSRVFAAGSASSSGQREIGVAPVIQLELR